MKDDFNSTFQLGVQARVLVVSDDNSSARIWGYILKEKDIEPILVGSQENVLDLWAEVIPDLIVIDMHSMEFNGVELVSQLRQYGVVPILLLTPWNNETHVLEAYQAGVDECVIKPISPALFQVKVKALLLRTWLLPAESLKTISVGDVKLDPTRRLVNIGNQETIKLTNLEFRLLHLLMSHPGWVFTTEDIVQKVWGYYGNGDSILLKNLVYRLRRKVDPNQANPRYIHTEAGLGYKFQDTNN